MDSTKPVPQPQSLAAKLAEVMGLVGRIEKKGLNPHQHYKFARESDVVEAVSSHLADRLVAVIPAVENVHFEPYQTSKGTPGFFAVVTMSYTFKDGESGEELKVSAIGAGTDQPGDKAFYKAQTGAKKYALTQAFLIATGDDPEEAQAPKARSESATPKPTQAPAEAAAPAEAVTKVRMIWLRREIRAANPQHEAVVDGTIGGWNLQQLEELAKKLGLIETEGAA